MSAVPRAPSEPDEQEEKDADGGGRRRSARRSRAVDFKHLLDDNEDEPGAGDSDGSGGRGQTDPEGEESADDWRPPAHGVSQAGPRAGFSLHGPGTVWKLGWAVE